MRTCSSGVWNQPSVLVDVVRSGGIESAQTALLGVAHERDDDVLHDGAERLSIRLLELILLGSVHLDDGVIVSFDDFTYSRTEHLQLRGGKQRPRYDHRSGR
jgi:hypothetical protein